MERIVRGENDGERERDREIETEKERKRERVESGQYVANESYNIIPNPPQKKQTKCNVIFIQMKKSKYIETMI